MTIGVVELEAGNGALHRTLVLYHKVTTAGPMTLVVSLECRNFRQPPQKLINIHELRTRCIDSTTYDHTNELSEEVDRSPMNGRRAHRLAITELHAFGRPRLGLIR